MPFFARACVAATLLAARGAAIANAGESDVAPLQPATVSANDAEADRIGRIISPHIEGDALIIEGEIDSHIYDYLQYEAARIAPLKFIELNSLGGNSDWALEIARKVKDLGKITLIASDHYCASACAYIFAAGR